MTVCVVIPCLKRNTVLLRCIEDRPVHLRRNVGFLTVITVPTVITPYSTVNITVAQNYGVRPYKTVPTVQYDFDRLAPISAQNSCSLFTTVYE
jgi:hypothetical protein